MPAHLCDLPDHRDLAIPRKQSLTFVQLGHDATNAPDVNRSAVLCRAEQQLWCPVPQRDDLKRVGPDWNVEGTSQAEIGDLDLPAIRQQDVLWLNVSMENAPGVADRNALQDLKNDRLQVVEIALEHIRRSWIVLDIVNVRLKVSVHMLKYEIESRLCEDDV